MADKVGMNMAANIGKEKVPVSSEASMRPLSFMSKHLPVGKKLYIYRYSVVDSDPGPWNLTKINK
jgi:hypothetical protein